MPRKFKVCRLKIGFSILGILMLLMLVDSLFLAYYIMEHHGMSPDTHNYLYSNVYTYYKKGLLFLLLELFAIVVVVIYIVSVLRYSVPLRNFKSLVGQLNVDINTPIKQNQEISSDLVNETTDVITKLQQRIRDLINKRTKILAAISHDLRVPLTRLSMRVELTEDQEFAKDMQADIDEMTTMISDILNFAREDAFHGRRKSFDINKMLGGLIKDFKLVGYHIDYQPPVPSLMISGYEAALKRVFNNIIENAGKYAENITVTIKVEHDKLLLKIVDDGPGIDEEQLKHVFDAYYRADKNEQGGTGLGLNTAYEIIKIHGGDVRLENRTPHGLCVYIELPLY